MIAVKNAVLILLAAGRSSRFGAANKLEAEFLGKAVGLHVVTAFEDMQFLARVAVVDDCALDFAGRGYTVLHNDAPEEGMARSVALGVEWAAEQGADAVVIALADMPRVTAAHVHRLLDRAEGDDAVVASSDGVQARPPVVFGKGRFGYLQSLQGDAGARELVKRGHHVVTSPAELIDIDTPEDLEALRGLVRGRA